MKCCWLSAQERTGFGSVQGPPRRVTLSARGPSEHPIKAVDVVVRKMRVGLETHHFVHSFAFLMDVKPQGVPALDTCVKQLFSTPGHSPRQQPRT